MKVFIIIIIVVVVVVFNNIVSLFSTHTIHHNASPQPLSFWNFSVSHIL